MIFFKYALYLFLEFSKEIINLPKVDIGLPYENRWKSTGRFVKNVDLEPSARKRTLEVSLDSVHSPINDLAAPIRRQVLAEHYGIFNDLYGSSYYFVPSVNFGLDYPYFESDKLSFDNHRNKMLEENSEFVQPVYTGNFISSFLAMVIHYYYYFKYKSYVIKSKHG